MFSSWDVNILAAKTSLPQIVGLIPGNLSQEGPLYYKKPLLAGWKVACEQALHLGESLEVTLGPRDASERGAPSRAVLSRPASLAIIGKLAGKLGEKEAKDSLANDVMAKLYLQSTLRRHVNKSVTQHIYLLINY